MSVEAFSEHFPAIVTATAAALSVVGAVAGLGWKVRGWLADVKDSTAVALAAHEKLDQIRQTENMHRFESMSAEMVRRSELNSERFEKISVALARMERNGNGKS